MLTLNAEFEQAARQRLAKYQADILDLLHHSSDVGDVAEQLRQRLEQLNSESTTDAVDPRMVDVAMKLTKKWGVRKNSPPADSFSDTD